MSGINEIKKKTKISIDEMYDNQEVGYLDSQEEIKPEIKPTDRSVKQQENNPVNQPDSHKAGKPEIHLDQQEFQTNRQGNLMVIAKQQATKVPTFKMTFNLTHDIYKAFNDLYAKRMLQGRKTEKSEMISEAIQWLIKMEESN